jgi:Tfp pilus assembly protein PilF
MKADAVVEIAKIEQLAEANLSEACARARELVAAHPADEQAALLLGELVRKWAAADPGPVDAPSPRLARPVQKAARALQAGNDEEAEILLRDYLKREPKDVAAMRLMAEIASQCGFNDNAILILHRALLIDPNYVEGWVSLGKIHDQLGQVRKASDAVREALTRNPADPLALAFQGTLLVKLRRMDEAREVSEQVIRQRPHVSGGWMNFGFLLKTVGEFGAAVAAYRTATALNPANGGAWWGLANLKLAPFFNFDVEAMEAALADDKMDENARIDVLFALAKAYDNLRDYDKAAARLDEGNARRKARFPYDAESAEQEITKALNVLSADFFAKRSGWGDPSPDPIFIVGLPRSGSTLIEQILSSHSAIEGTEELFNVQRMAEQLAGGNESRGLEAAVARLSQNEMEALGRRYIEETRYLRRTDRPFFTDKMPGNWRYLGLILTMLPNAKIVDIRRNPLDCCFANYAQHFMWGVRFAYAQNDLGKFYRDYVRMMRHIDEIQPGRVHQIVYEDLVDNFESEVRRLLEYLGLPFEQSCLDFHETERAVHTPSSEQVRQPINRSGIGKSRHYEPWLGELRTALGDLIVDYRH